MIEFRRHIRRGWCRLAHRHAWQKHTHAQISHVSPVWPPILPRCSWTCARCGEHYPAQLHADVVIDLRED